MASETETPEVTEEATQDGAETGQTVDTEEPAAQPKTYTESELDSRISAALKAQLERIETQKAQEKAEAEKKQLAEAGKHDELYQQTQAELDALKAEIERKDYQFKAQQILANEGLAQYSDVLIGGTNSVEELEQKAKAFKTAVDSAIETGIKSALNTGSGRVPESKPTPDKTLDQMDAEELKAWKKANGYF